ncbi:MAG: hypothetical protein H7062_13995 [Candidatus Saccharimonas sp.]|nr:hypothetical protein [Planctomycetaceae bacterium]
MECHSQGKDFWQTGHAQTLRRAVGEKSIALLQQLDQSNSDLVKALRLHFQEQDVLAVDTESDTEQQLSLDWCFGSGRHACTWVGTLPDSWGATDLVEFRWSWYSEIEGFDVTPGQASARGDGYFGGLGVLFDHPKARQCFACHASYLSMPAGRLDESSIKPGVTCQRCHGPQQRHVESGGNFVSESLRNLDQHESINRCAQCHRRADEREPSDIRTDNPEIVRFQPVGLLQSACFKNSAKLTCVTCHDPHRPLEAQDSRGIWQCVQCHNPAHTDHTHCAAKHQDDCLACHMPKVRSSAPVRFTDHWIRVRRDGEGSR